MMTWPLTARDEVNDTTFLLKLSSCCCQGHSNRSCMEGLSSHRGKNGYNTAKLSTLRLKQFICGGQKSLLCCWLSPPTPCDKVTSGLVSAFVTTRLDYCNSVLTRPSTIYDWFTPVCPECVAARLVEETEMQDHITPVLQSLPWLPIKFCI